tara:strand:- start:70644 stop:72008 length:1365 start_codon:yes stop_codon:yes gene_type:complete
MENTHKKSSNSASNISPEVTSKHVLHKDASKTIPAIINADDSLFGIYLEEQIETLREKAPDVIKTVIDNIAKEKDELDVSDRRSNPELKAHMAKEREDRKYNNGNVIYKDGIPRVKGPIRIVRGAVNTDMEAKAELDIESLSSQRISSSYGSSNYAENVSLSNIQRPEEKLGRYSQPQNGLGLIPEIDAKMYCGDDEIQLAKEVCNDNKSKLQKQMNIVALYSIKDAKPFYFISSAEARMAIDYINMCRKFKQDIISVHLDTIENIVKNVSSIKFEIEEKGFDFSVSSLLWESNLADIEPDEYMHSQMNLIHSIEKKSSLPQKISDNQIEVQELTVKVDRKDEGNVYYKIWEEVIENHASIQLFSPCFFYLICGTNTMSSISSYNGSHTKKVTLPNTTEKMKLGIVKNYSAPYGNIPMFSDSQMGEKRLTIVSKEVDTDKIIITEYVLEFISTV